MTVTQTAMQAALIKAGIKAEQETGPAGEQKKRRPYRYRDMTIREAIKKSDGQQFYISGEDKLMCGRSGILEWCFSYDDACERQELMQRHMQFGPLSLFNAGSCYVYRSLPCNCSNDLWYVEGIDAYGGGCGVLEWCLNENDAVKRLVYMSMFRQFSKLNSCKWVENGPGINHLVNEHITR